MKSATLIAMPAVIFSLAMTTVLLCQSSIRHASSPRSASEVWFDESPAPAIDPPDEIVVDLAGHAWLQLESAIRISADEKDTLVVWIVDQSSSMAERREEIADRFERTFDLQQAQSENQLLHSVISFGERVQQTLDQPTDDAGQIAAQFRKVEDDPTGVERTMRAVQSASEYVRSMWQRFQSWNRLFVIVTDERGDDYEMVDKVAKRCSRMGIRVFCLGNASPFGAEKSFCRYTYPDGFQVDIPVDQGPETIAHQTLQIPVIGQPVVEPAHISSGFGPYAIEWLCRETGGQFWIYQDTASERFLPGRMNDYRPDYISASDFAETTNFNRAKLALIDAALSSHKEMPRVLPIVVRGDVLNVLRTELTERQKECVAASSLVQKLAGLLESGLEDRAELDSLRWRASFDLAWGQALAAKVRLETLNLRLASMKVEPKEFKEPTNNTWKLIEASEPLEISQQHADMVSQARQVLQQVVTEHPKTPFSFVAQRELNRGFGWKWIESHSDGPALTSRKRSEQEWKYRWGGRPEFLGRPKLVPRRKPPRL